MLTTNQFPLIKDAQTISLWIMAIMRKLISTTMGRTEIFCPVK